MLSDFPLVQSLCSTWTALSQTVLITKSTQSCRYILLSTSWNTCSAVQCRPQGVAVVSYICCWCSTTVRTLHFASAAVQQCAAAVQGLSAGDVLDAVVLAAQRAGLLIMFDLHHLAVADGIGELWYDDDKYPITQVHLAWHNVVQRCAVSSEPEHTA